MDSIQGKFKKYSRAKDEKKVRQYLPSTIPGIHEKIDDEFGIRQGPYEKGFQSLTQDWKPRIITQCGA